MERARLVSLLLLIVAGGQLKATASPYVDHTLWGYSGAADAWIDERDGLVLVAHPWSEYRAPGIDVYDHDGGPVGQIDLPYDRRPIAITGDSGSGTAYGVGSVEFEPTGRLWVVRDVGSDASLGSESVLSKPASDIAVDSELSIGMVATGDGLLVLDLSTSPPTETGFLPIPGATSVQIDVVRHDAIVAGRLAGSPISIVDLTTDPPAVDHSIALGDDAAQSIAIADGSVVVALAVEDAIVIYDLETLERTGTIPAPGGAEAVAYDSARDVIAFTHYRPIADPDTCQDGSRYEGRLRLVDRAGTVISDGFTSFGPCVYGTDQRLIAHPTTATFYGWSAGGPLHAYREDVTPPRASFSRDPDAAWTLGLTTLWLHGTVVDDRAGIEDLILRYENLATGEVTQQRLASTTGTIEGCTAGRRACTWRTSPPVLPGVYVVSATAIDRAHNIDAAPPRATIIVV